MEGQFDPVFRRREPQSRRSRLHSRRARFDEAELEGRYDWEVVVQLPEPERWLSTLPSA